MFATRKYRGLELLTCEPLAERGVPHGFTSRVNGFGERENGDVDRATLADALGVSHLTYMKQVHGKTVRSVAASDEIPECDGLTTSEVELGLIVHTADCLPLLFWSESENEVAAVHAGWRGTLAGVTTAAVEALGPDRAEGLHVAIGPAIRSCCFEVGDEVVEAFVASGRNGDEISRPGPRERRHVDLIADNCRQLVEGGVPENQIYDSGRCTVCENERFYSYRREGPGVGRLMGVIAIR